MNLTAYFGIRVGNDQSLALISACSKDLKRNQTQHMLFRISEQTKSLQLIGKAAEYKFKSKSKPLQIIWQSLPKAIPDDNRRF